MANTGKLRSIGQVPVVSLDLFKQDYLFITLGPGILRLSSSLTDDEVWCHMLILVLLYLDKTCFLFPFLGVSVTLLATLRVVLYPLPFPRFSHRHLGSGYLFSYFINKMCIYNVYEPVWHASLWNKRRYELCLIFLI